MSLLANRTVKSLYEDADRFDEWATKRFWQHILSKAVFTGLDWVVTSEQPPKKTHELRRIDIQVEYGTKPTVVMFAELKRIRATTKDVLLAQRQVLAGCQTYCREHGKDYLWAMSCYGPNFRLWAYTTKGQRLSPMYPSALEDNSREAYLGFKASETGLMRWFNIIKENHEPTDDLVSMYSGSNMGGLDLDMSDAVPGHYDPLSAEDLSAMALEADDHGKPGPAAPVAGSSLQMEYGQAESHDPGVYGSSSAFDPWAVDLEASADPDSAPGPTAPDAGSSSQMEYGQAESHDPGVYGSSSAFDPWAVDLEASADPDSAPEPTAPDAGSSSQRRNDQPSSSSAPATAPAILLQGDYKIVGIGDWHGIDPMVGSVNSKGEVKAPFKWRPLCDWQAAEAYANGGAVHHGWVARGSTGTRYFCTQDIWLARDSAQRSTSNSAQEANRSTSKKHRRHR